MPKFVLIHSSIIFFPHFLHTKSPNELSSSDPHMDAVDDDILDENIPLFLCVRGDLGEPTWREDKLPELLDTCLGVPVSDELSLIGDPFLGGALDRFGGNFGTVNVGRTSLVVFGAAVFGLGEIRGVDVAAIDSFVILDESF